MQASCDPSGAYASSIRASTSSQSSSLRRWVISWLAFRTKAKSGGTEACHFRNEASAASDKR